MFQITRGLKRLFSFIAAAVMLFSFVYASAESFDEVQPADQLVRVFLTRLNLNERLDVTLNTSYLLTSENGHEMHFQPGSELSFMLRSGKIYLYYQGMSQQIGFQLALKRSDAVNTPDKGFQMTNFSPEYLGDLSLDISEGKLRPILTIHVEDYLLGVVPYEMGNDFPLEALKAQAVAARTYALRSRNPKDAFDVYDNTNDQVFRGYLPGNERAEQAVLETSGICGFYKGKLAQCFYSASNGGQTEMVQMVWPGREDLGYYAFGEDPYDIENPASTVRSLELMKRYKEETAPYAVRKLIADTFSSELAEAGYDVSPENIRVDAVRSVSVDTPNMSSSKLMTRIHFEMEISVRKQQTIVSLVDNDTEEVSLFPMEPIPSPQNIFEFQPIVTAEPVQEKEIRYGPFVPWGNPVLIDMDIFPDAEKAFSLSINSNYQNEIWSVVETDESFTVEVRRFGHGVGMSQRGAQVMAEKYNKNFKQILDFYYPSMELKKYPEQERLFTMADEAISSTAGPAPSPTPRPTLMPTTADAQEGEWYASVTEISDDSSLNLRSAPSLNSDILMRLYKGQRLLVLERCPEEGWVKVRTDVVEGYVMESYLTRE